MVLIAPLVTTDGLPSPLSSDEHWWSLTKVLGTSRTGPRIPRLATLALRLANQDYLDALVNQATVAWDVFELMEAFQRAGVPAGVCQTAEDRYERDPQLKHLEWLVELNQSEIGRWPVKEVPVKFSETPHTSAASWIDMVRAMEKTTTTCFVRYSA